MCIRDRQSLGDIGVVGAVEIELLRRKVGRLFAFGDEPCVYLSLIHIYSRMNRSSAHPRGAACPSFS